MLAELSLHTMPSEQGGKKLNSISGLSFWISFKHIN